MGMDFGSGRMCSPQLPTAHESNKVVYSMGFGGMVSLTLKIYNRRLRNKRF